MPEPDQARSNRLSGALKEHRVKVLLTYLKAAAILLGTLWPVFVYFQSREITKLQREGQRISNEILGFQAKEERIKAEKEIRGAIEYEKEFSLEEISKLPSSSSSSSRVYSGKYCLKIKNNGDIPKAVATICIAVYQAECPVPAEGELLEVNGPEIAKGPVHWIRKITRAYSIKPLPKELWNGIPIPPYNSPKSTEHAAAEGQGTGEIRCGEYHQGGLEFLLTSRGSGWVEVEALVWCTSDPMDIGQYYPDLITIRESYPNSEREKPNGPSS